MAGLAWFLSIITHTETSPVKKALKVWGIKMKKKNICGKVYTEGLNITQN